MINNDRAIVPHRDLKRLLASVEKPGRYVGGEYGAMTHKPDPADYTVCIAFPDLYEIAMSNQAVRILYKLFNDAEGLHAERAFSPAPDFREGLKKAEVPLYTLESGLPVADFDILALTIGYELAFTNVLSFLETSGIPLKTSERSDNHPIVIAGGPAMTNPEPWSEFLDAVFIGEAEGTVVDALLELRAKKNAGKDRSESLAYLAASPGFWTPGADHADRELWMGFGAETGLPAALPVPSMIPVQDHGVIEIMRGCPNKCRFCHAGVFYRPYRQKRAVRILEEAEYLIDSCGYRDITLSSLSTGDYVGLDGLVEELNRRYSHRRVSFSLPSLRVNSVTLSLIGRLGAVRKSGLTFAVETPTSAGQRGINKEVPADKVAALLNEARSQGWKLAKFYFMLGLPVDNGPDESQAIVDYLLDVQAETGVKLNVNLGTFIPKPHTPFERSPQLTDEQAIQRIRAIRDGLKSNRNIRFSFHSPFVSYLEGVLSRGDRRAGDLALEAWKNGAEFDAWDDRMDKDAWRRAIDAADWDVEGEICRGKAPDDPLPWSAVRLGASANHFAREADRAARSELTPPCAPVCPDHCGVCGPEAGCINAEPLALHDSALMNEHIPEEDSEPQWKRLLLRFGKDGPAVYLGHLDVMNVFEKALQRSGLVVDFSRGFNPKPRIEFAQPLSLGVRSEGEVATIRVAFDGREAGELAEMLNRSLPEGIRVLEASWIAPPPPGRKTVKVMSAFWGSDWLLTPDEADQGEPAPVSTASFFESIESISAAITERCRETGISDDCSVTPTGEGALSIRLRHGGTAKHNLMRLLESVLGGNPAALGYSLTRIRCWAKGSGVEPVSFPEAFSPE